MGDGTSGSSSPERHENDQSEVYMTSYDHTQKKKYEAQQTLHI